MNTTHDDATSWRDLADQLTPEQIAELEYCEREQVSSASHHATAWSQRSLI
jgi:hypothetical protein